MIKKILLMMLWLWATPLLAQEQKGGDILLAQNFEKAPSKGEAVFTLRQALSQAYNYSPRIKAALADVKASDYSLLGTRASRLPQVNLATSFGFLNATIDANDQTYSGANSSLTLSASAPIITFGRQEALEKTGESNTRSARLAFIQEKAGLYGTTIENYFSLLLAEQIYQLRLEDRNLNRQQLAEAQTRFDRQNISVTDLRIAKAAFNDSQIALLEADARLKTQRQAFVSLLGIDDFGTLSVVSSKEFLDGLPSSLAKAKEIMLANHPALKEADETIVRGEAEIEQSTAGFFPNISVQGGISSNYQGPELTRQQYVTMNFNMALASGGSSIIEQIRLKSQLKRLRYNKAITETQLINDLENRWKNYQNYSKIVDDNYNNLIQYQLIYNDAQKTFRVKRISIGELIQVRRRLIEQYINYAFAVNNKNVLGLYLANILGVIN